MTENEIQDAARRLGVALDARQARALLRFRDLLVEANQRFNLTALTDDASILALHFLDSLTAVQVIRGLQANHSAALELIDVGAGGGFPGIPLKIALPELRVTLMDGTAKKVQFCAEVIRTLALQHIRAIQDRAEEAGHRPEHRERYDVAIARAVAPMPTLAEYLLPLTRVGGTCIAMKGSDAQAEAARAAGAIARLGGAIAAVTPVTLPGRDERRALIVINKLHPTPQAYPRRGGAPRKSPLP
ncbi:MAG: 16S rRNA (guanine(527)-N(7))-methyltransferase RsmG [Chloroflexi bacterium]|jgi:16S rRNA (guanine527-N7)-methyltransferase|uniref:Ribosomal RNA small subunit methyltransferase G n=1 Tax=Candidatus Thermofonsia Clade 3 bacterium TaxID=2364212 RepID=A0A2M8QE79_9CHLR|nr:16S rRNA (guanine(527)-N(7))-methyltransferase RsmG [Candidatus Roseilinea sp. NK_OTU-006]PJF48113.1 MAG: 16S rRNA (guanine(527)-N(7))-methyltransferase RsmG [Candidatus Thermofonsia Clade 3 bacterium]RMG63944.1 MAG: 16S rRNA (guanine(527)-N(7))-methyltransferase RsmG [Chloroflexota bacterium]